MLSERAKELELAGKVGDYGVIEKKNAAMLEMYDSVIKAGKEYLDGIAAEKPPEEENAEPLKEITAENVTEYISRICEACDAFDGDAVVEICAEAADCSVNGIALKPLFSEVSAAAEDFEYDEACGLAKGISEKIKGE